MVIPGIQNRTVRYTKGRRFLKANYFPIELGYENKGLRLGAPKVKLKLRLTVICGVKKSKSNIFDDRFTVFYR